MLSYAMTPMPLSPSRRRLSSSTPIENCCGACSRGLRLLIERDRRKGNEETGRARPKVREKGISLSLDDDAVQEQPGGPGSAGGGHHRHAGLPHRGLPASAGEKSPKKTASNTTCPHTGFFAMHPPKRGANGSVVKPEDVAHECKTPVYSILKRTCEAPAETSSFDELALEENRRTRDRVHSLLMPLRYDRNGERINEHGKHHVSFNGTAHVSSSSAEQVRDMILTERPEGVMVELCPKRLQKMRAGGFGDTPGGLAEMLKVLLRGVGSGGGLPLQAMLEQGLRGFYGNFKSMGIEPGAEFKTAVQTAEEIGARVGGLAVNLASYMYPETVPVGRLQVITGDVDITLTMEGLTKALQQDWQQMLACRELQDLDVDHTGGILSIAEQLKSREKAGQINSIMQKCAPHVYEVMIEDRDRTMAGEIRATLPDAILKLVRLPMSI
ncbi:hypothetical protein FOL47_011363 [Perkinsus chesapeaki]|uniref:Uncharacterized protein n=1 Tax=Perkinsus chesapeaki TaxID=330153 RepID=A0A7J6MMK6_PERCH|nr:hypothetical protein FOL47_011363 [Perkinsus chesapeaki]